LVRLDLCVDIPGSGTLNHNSAEVNSRALVWYDAPLVRRWPRKLIATGFVRVADDPPTTRKASPLLLMRLRQATLRFAA